MGSNSRGVDGFGGGVTLDGCLSIALCCRKATCLPGERWKCELFVLPLPSRPSHPVFASTLLCIPFHPTPPGICPVSASESSPAWRSMAAAEGRMHGRRMDVLPLLAVVAETLCCNTYYRTVVMQQDRLDACSLFLQSWKISKLEPRWLSTKTVWAGFLEEDPVGTKSPDGMKPFLLKSYLFFPPPVTQ